ncbi:MAG TPA: endonuclease/exonuclease/phosphatase family protein [Longimicrobiales bacterium]|nr:endonuclease/exonuclease/phosphatase family protein [Longimicrobiales bacterium]
MRRRPTTGGSASAAAALSALLALSACATGYNYPDPSGPRYAAPRPPNVAPADFAPAPAATSDTLRVVSFNIEYAAEVDSALRVLTRTPELSDLDVVLLQEMDEEGTRRIAATLGMGYVYYPASYRSGTGRDFGNAVLSRWPMEDDAKLVLPHHSLFTGSQRTATAVTLRVGGRRVRVYSVHLGTVVNQWPWHRDDQLQAVLDDAEPYRTVLIGGDMNSGGIGGLAVKRGYDWPTRDGPDTVHFWRWDHIFVRGLATPESAAAGTVLDNHDASDHRPVWVRVVLSENGGA